MNPKIGELLPDGGIRYPSETLAGAHFERGQFAPAPAIVYNLGAHYFCVGDVWPPPGFDAQAAVDALKAELATPVAKKADAKP